MGNHTLADFEAARDRWHAIVDGRKAPGRMPAKSPKFKHVVSDLSEKVHARVDRTALRKAAELNNRPRMKASAHGEVVYERPQGNRKSQAD